MPITIKMKVSPISASAFINFDATEGRVYIKKGSGLEVPVRAAVTMTLSAYDKANIPLIREKKVTFFLEIIGDENWKPPVAEVVKAPPPPPGIPAKVTLKSMSSDGIIVLQFSKKMIIRDNTPKDALKIEL